MKTWIGANVVLACIAAGPPALAQAPEYVLRCLGEASKIQGIHVHGGITFLGRTTPRAVAVSPRRSC